jgi:regulator of protease activity HflC (stomatin/prohibitin superfamily)
MIILPEERGLLYHKNEYKKLLMPGKHFIPPFHRVEKYRIDESFNPKDRLIKTMLEEDKDISDAIDVVDIPDNHLLLIYMDGNLEKAVLGSDDRNKLYFWKSPLKYAFTLINLDDVESASSYSRAILGHPLIKKLGIALTYNVAPWEKGLLFIDNQFVRLLDGGTYFFWKGTKPVEVKNTDHRQQQLDITGQEIMTADKVPLRLNFFCQYRIVDVMKAALEVKDYKEQFYVTAQVALRDYLGTISFDAVMEKREGVGRAVAEMLKGNGGQFGLEIISAGIKDIVLPGEIRDIMNQVLIAEKKAQANVIMRREETASTRSLLNTAKLMEENAVLSHLKELEYIERIAEKVSKISISGKTQILDELRTLFVPAIQK